MDWAIEFESLLPSAVRSVKWCWQLGWLRRLNEGELEMVQYLESLLLPIQPEREAMDKWTWIMDKSLEYKVNTTYKKLILRCAESLLEEGQKILLNYLLKAAVPSKFLVHAWRLLLNRMPTRVALEQRGVMTFNQGPSCVFCFRYNEEIEHLFFCCHASSLVWQQV